jgi:hypothetical protein
MAFQRFQTYFAHCLYASKAALLHAMRGRLAFSALLFCVVLGALLGSSLASCTTSSDPYKQFQRDVQSLRDEHDSLEAVQTMMDGEHARNVLKFEALSANVATAALVRTHDSLQKVHAALLEAHETLLDQHLELIDNAVQFNNAYKTKRMTLDQVLEHQGAAQPQRKELRSDHVQIVEEHGRLNAKHDSLMKELQRQRAQE